MTQPLWNKATLALALTASLFACSACQTLPADTAISDPAPVATSPTQEPAPTPNSSDMVLASGTFEGRSDHIVTGNVSVVQSNGTYVIKLADNFSLDNAPDPKVGLGQNGYDATTKSGHLIALSGSSSYEVPTGINVQDYNEIYIWCEKFDVPLGVAKLQTQ